MLIASSVINICRRMTLAQTALDGGAGRRSWMEELDGGAGWRSWMEELDGGVDGGAGRRSGRRSWNTQICGGARQASGRRSAPQVVDHAQPPQNWRVTLFFHHERLGPKRLCHVRMWPPRADS